MAAEGHYDTMASDVEMQMKQRCGTEILHADNTAPSDIHQHLQNVYGDQALDVSTVRRIHYFLALAISRHSISTASRVSIANMSVLGL